MWLALAIPKNVRGTNMLLKRLSHRIKNGLLGRHAVLSGHQRYYVKK